MRCSFCGYDLDPDEAESACGSCPVAKGCHLVRCPRCGYEMPPEAKLVRWVRKLRQRAKARPAAPVPGMDDRLHLDKSQ
jgi:rubredoxin